MLVTVGIRSERVGIDDAFVEDDFVSFGFFDGFEGFGLDISSDLVRIVDSDFSRVLLGLGDFVDDVDFEKVKVELFLPSSVEGETADLAFDFSIFGSISVILRTSGSKFHDMITGFEFVGEFSEMIAEGWSGFVGLSGEDDGIGVEVQHLFGLEFAQTLSVEFESSPASGETGHEDVDVGLNLFFVVDASVDHFDHFVVHDAQRLKFLTVVVEEFIESTRFGDAFDLTLVPLLPVFSPETVQHHFGQGAPSGIFLDLVGVETNTFVGLVLLEVLSSFVFIVPHPVGPSAGFLLDLEKRVDVRGEQLIGLAREVPDLVHALDDVTLIDGFLQFGGTPSPHETTF